MQMTLYQKLNHYLDEKKRIKQLLNSEYIKLENIETCKNDITRQTYISLKEQHINKIKILKTYLLQVNKRIEQIKNEIYVNNLQEKLNDTFSNIRSI